MSANNMYGDGVSDWKPTPDKGADMNKVFSYEAQENSDMANGTNVLEQFKGTPTTAKKYNPLGRQGKDF